MTLTKELASANIEQNTLANKRDADYLILYVRVMENRWTQLGIRADRQVTRGRASDLK